MTDLTDLPHFALKRVIQKAVLERPKDYEWTLQGFGMLRCYFGNDLRLHVWDSRHQTQDVSLIHDHPWGFKSYVVAGRIWNQRYAVVYRYGLPHKMQIIVCGAGGGLSKIEPLDVGLSPLPPELYLESDSYRQEATELHASHPRGGTVTIIQRIPGKDSEHAHVCWPAGEQWVSAEPRKATPEEVNDIVGRALATWF